VLERVERGGELLAERRHDRVVLLIRVVEREHRHAVCARLDADDGFLLLFVSGCAHRVCAARRTARQ